MVRPRFDVATCAVAVMLLSLGCIIAQVLPQYTGGTFLATGRLVSIVAVSVTLFLLSSTDSTTTKFAAFKSGQRQTVTSNADNKNIAGNDTHTENDTANRDELDEQSQFVAYDHERLSSDEIKSRSKDFLEMMQMRRTLRFFSKDKVPYTVIENCIAAAGTAPSGAHCQPWHFAVISDNETKAVIRTLVEKEEEINYNQRMGAAWVDEVNYLVSQLPEAYTKPYLTDAPYLIVAFLKRFEVTSDGTKIPARYPTESVGLACGILLSALQASNLVTLTSTPMGAESAIRKHLHMPDHYRVFLLLPVGYPAKDATVPYRKNERLPLDSILTHF